ncbi:MAG: dTDP-glucose 4,6-dehydratase [candidate division KSB1 bacterium]|nr:dTDP-glucose 4,6-dehydratase [candidate division KSB1 bacterium]MDZ7274371.1 dTDP-glucose 4,6-dehydratase [candidate division KSB1 bacterium]MDZ7284967.1 dTDP-glucose 4,6-dehydratase [candidate division KSB1 bacterium]MDZ7297612.1 dTDP-glucose 4,6-dehydratase [candidate division KSB1 bacterium]MDZ7306352.1 dTDP-glucose 4,6-dehydratase [candidate division KSB1 bacterium]
MHKILVTGGAGFIGSNFIHYLLRRHDDVAVINLDKLTYAGNLENLRDLQGHPNYHFVKGDICDAGLVDELLPGVEVVVNFAAESHVDRSIGSPDAFIRTDVFGAFVLLDASRRHGVSRFIQISTDEVYGSIAQGSFKETDALMPSSPYSASKAGADRLAYSYFVTYGLPVIITRCSNNFGPYQYPEKLISLFVTNAIEDKPLPIYGDGKNVRDWIYVEDHCDAIHFLMEHGRPGEVYNIGGGNERTNLEITDFILARLNKPASLKTFVTDRLGHDRRYSVDCSKLARLGWRPRHTLENALAQTIDWYVENRWWWEKLKSGEYLEFYRKNYGKSL